MEDLIGKEFYYLTVLCIDLEKTNTTSKSNTDKWYICKCKCGNIISVRADRLLRGKKSCGCLIGKNNTNKIYINETNGFGIAFLNGTNDGKYFIFDLEDIDVVQGRCWCMNDQGYIIGHIPKNGKYPYKRLHRAIMSKYENIEDKIIDHKNHLRYDNRKMNLRVCTMGDNNRNKINKPSNTGIPNISKLKCGGYQLTMYTNNDVYKKYSNDINYLVNLKNQIISNNPNIFEFSYNENEDKRIEDGNNNIIKPFKFI